MEPGALARAASPRASGAAAQPPHETLATRVSLLSGEGALDVFARARELERQGRRVVHLELGAPDASAPPHAVEAAVRALRDGDARYVATEGIPELREAIAAEMQSRGVPAGADQVMVTPSAKTAVFYAIMATAEAGAEVLVPDPGFPMYPSVARYVGAIPVGYSVDESNAPDVDDIAARITSRTRVLALNSPNNPTGGALTAAALERLAGLVEEHDLTVVSDDIYSRLVYEGDRAPCLAAFPGMLDRTIVVDGFSKTYAMTGYRLGYMVAPRRWIPGLTMLAVNGHTCVAPFIQRAGVAALTGPQDAVRTQVEAYRARRDRIVSGLRAMPGLSCPMPGGAFYAFPDFSTVLELRSMSSREFANRLLEDHGVAVLDGAAFGSRGEGRIRISFAAAQADLDVALSAIRDAIRALS